MGKNYSSYIQADVRARKSKDIVYCWSFTAPFVIISVGIWKPGDTVTTDYFIYLLNIMCDISQFVVVVGSKFIEISYIARLFMEKVLLKFGLYAMIVIDTVNNFRGHF